jgi:hypothetical protein
MAAQGRELVKFCTHIPKGKSSHDDDLVHSLVDLIKGKWWL